MGDMLVQKGPKTRWVQKGPHWGHVVTPLSAPPLRQPNFCSVFVSKGGCIPALQSAPPTKPILNIAIAVLDLGVVYMLLLSQVLTIRTPPPENHSNFLDYTSPFYLGDFFSWCIV